MFERFLRSDLPFIKSAGDVNQKVRAALSEASDRYHSHNVSLSAYEADLGVMMGNEAILAEEIDGVEERLFSLLKKK
ncbi:hypothetical protein A2U01_0085819, partial [Trifolium medium]|nr:hypothetical protein [Trifolium medium]